MSTITDNVELFVGTYEEFVLGYKLLHVKTRQSLDQSFANHAHTGSVRCIAANRVFLASGSVDETVRLFNMKKRAECGSLVQHDGTVTCLKFYGDSYLLSASEDSTICVWSVKNWQCLKTLRGHKGGVTSMSIHPSGKMLLSVSKDKTLKTWNLVKGRCAYTINLKAVSEFVEWSPDGDVFVVAINNRLDVYSATVAGVMHSIDFQKKIYAATFLENCVLAVGGEKADIELHHLERKMSLALKSAHENRVKDLSSWNLSSVFIFLASLSSDGWVKVWQIDSQMVFAAPVLVASVDTACRPTCLGVLSIAFQSDCESTTEEKDVGSKPKKKRKMIK